MSSQKLKTKNNKKVSSQNSSDRTDQNKHTVNKNKCSICHSTQLDEHCVPYIVVSTLDSAGSLNDPVVSIVHKKGECLFDPNAVVNTRIRIEYNTFMSKAVFLAQRCHKGASHIFFLRHHSLIPPDLIKILNSLDPSSETTRFYAHDNMCCPHRFRRRGSKRMHVSNNLNTNDTENDISPDRQHIEKFISILSDLRRCIREDATKSVKKTRMVDSPDTSDVSDKSTPSVILYRFHNISSSRG